MKQRATPSGHVRESVLQAMYRRALALHAKGELDAAEALYRCILAQVPESFHAQHMLGVLVGQRGDLAQSEQLLARAVRVDPGVAAAHANLGNTLRLRERLDEAMASYDRALQLQPDNARALKGRGLILWRWQRCAADVFIYIGDLSGVFAAAHGALRAGGLFAFSTELSRDADTRLQESLRYAHTERYLRGLVATTGWRVESMTEQVLRKEDEQDVAGHLAVLRRL
jgi:predicted TPR repeat methyltransferase